ncbi:MAG: tRNA pseudouridine(55) synthase TruB [Leptolyngbyaceae cyanobacterium SM2_5_2]|nr:tRNA pseudouridine(55) synthase TruB [Leptolyngbyaceae cyanobacterium SM2_5_2]
MKHRPRLAGLALLSVSCFALQVVDGFLNLNKARAMTSHDCVGAVRCLLTTKKVGHGGTLDPMAEGVLPIAVGRATRLLPYLPSDKAYEAVICFGLTTTTDDLEGNILTRQPAPSLTLDAIKAALPQFLGQITQVPPVFSAIQVQGQRLYDLARRGEAVTPPSRQVEVHHLEVRDWQPGDYPELTLSIDCGPGTYIRSIARDLGQILSTGATLAHLTRTRSGGFDLAQSLTLEQVKALVETHTLALEPPESALGYLPSVALEPDLARRWQQGQKLPPPCNLLPDTPYRVLHAITDDFLGIGQLESRAEGPILKARMVFQPQP